MDSCDVALKENTPYFDFNSIPKKYQSDKEIIELFLTIDGYQIRYMSEKVRSSVFFTKMAIKSNRNS